MAHSRQRRPGQNVRPSPLSAQERASRLLDERTERLARRSNGDGATADDAAQVLICAVGPEYYGLPLGAVAEILAFRAPMPVPGGPPGLIGMLGRGGHLVSVIDLGVAVEQAATSSGGESSERHIVLLKQEKPRVALCVDRALAVENVVPLTDADTTEFRMNAVVAYAKTAGSADQDKVVALLDLERLLRPFLSPFSVPGV
ncbi:chemotaxis protein CheW [Microvirga sp. TS319]|uniref:chemotaxis protein CheW n=1 Tax=Microvirga sp. TS319 TaxID=3241165 RepID=UPI00351A014F